MTHTVQTAVVGVTGYAGAELARLLLRHPRLKGVPPVFAGRVESKDLLRGGVPLAEIHPEFLLQEHHHCHHGERAQTPAAEQRILVPERPLVAVFLEQALDFGVDFILSCSVHSNSVFRCQYSTVKKFAHKRG